MPDQVELFDGLLAKIKAILAKCEDTVKEQVENTLTVARDATKVIAEQVNNIHASIDEFAAKLEKAEENAQTLADRLVLELNLEIALLQAEMQKLLDQLRQTKATTACKSSCCCCSNIEK